MWRPLDWAEVRQDVLENTKPWSGNITLAQAEGNFFEAGADAMLEVLRKMGVYMTASKNGILHITPESTLCTASLITKGKLVFIPDDDTN